MCGFESHVGYVFVIDHVKDSSGDWQAIFLNDSLKYEGHGIPTFIWLQVIAETAPHSEIEIRIWETNMVPCGEEIYPASMMDLMLDKDRYQLVGIDGADACVLH